MFLHRVALVSELRGACSRRINIHRRLVYHVLASAGIMKMLSLRSHYNST